MSDEHYLISEASKKTGTEAHVLRYWEEELELKIPRNELGHRYYTEAHIELFQEIQELKNKGYALRTIKNLLVGNELVGAEPEFCGQAVEGRMTADEPAFKAGTGEERVSSYSADGQEHHMPAEMTTAEDLQLIQEEKLARFQAIMTDIMTEALARNNPALSEEVSNQVGDKLIKEINYLAREREEVEEERFRRLDEALRAVQKNNKGRAEAAAAKAPVMKMKKKKRFGKFLT